MSLFYFSVILLLHEFMCMFYISLVASPHLYSLLISNCFWVLEKVKTEVSKFRLLTRRCSNLSENNYILFSIVLIHPFDPVRSYLFLLYIWYVFLYYIFLKANFPSSLRYTCPQSPTPIPSPTLHKTQKTSPTK